MLGTFAGALDARKIDAKDGRLSCEVRGEVEDEGGVLIIKRVHATHNLRAGDPAAVRDTVERVHSVYAQLPGLSFADSRIPHYVSVEIVAEQPGSHLDV